jgi:hypothetical protein
VEDSLEVLEELGDGRQLLRFVSGALAGRTVIAFPESDFIYLSPFERAERLLLTLLDAEQVSDWRANQTFRVTTKFGTVELGRIQDIGYWPVAGSELRLCVLPSGKRLPGPDIWTNLLLVLTHDPRHFFTVANWRMPNGTWYKAPVPGFEKASTD